MRAQDTCAPLTFGSKAFHLNQTAIIREFYLRGSKYVYMIDGLRLEGDYDVSPCDAAHRAGDVGDRCVRE